MQPPPCSHLLDRPRARDSASSPPRAARRDALGTEVVWVHSSDLADPTPFLVRGPRAADHRHAVRRDAGGGRLRREYVAPAREHAASSASASAPR